MINVGTGKEITIKRYAIFLKKLNYKGKILFDKTKPNGTPRKVIDSKIALKYGWKPKISLSKGFDNTFKDFVKNYG